jgi:hypothetical protein
MRRQLLAAVLVALLFAPAGEAWTWPAAGVVLQPFLFDPAHPYAAGQHRGLDVGGDPGATVAAPAAGTVTFAGTVPSSGKSVTITTADGYAVTLTHLGSISVARGALVAEGDRVGTIGPTGDPEVLQPYVHVGVRIAAQSQGYLDPLTFLPARVPVPAALVPPVIVVEPPAAPLPVAEPAPAPVADPVPLVPPTAAPDAPPLAVDPAPAVAAEAVPGPAAAAPPAAVPDPPAAPLADAAPVVVSDPVADPAPASLSAAEPAAPAAEPAPAPPAPVAAPAPAPAAEPPPVDPPPVQPPAPAPDPAPTAVAPAVTAAEPVAPLAAPPAEPGHQDQPVRSAVRAPASLPAAVTDGVATDDATTDDATTDDAPRHGGWAAAVSPAQRVLENRVPENRVLGNRTLVTHAARVLERVAADARGRPRPRRSVRPHASAHAPAPLATVAAIALRLEPRRAGVFLFALAAGTVLAAALLARVLGAVRMMVRCGTDTKEDPGRPGVAVCGGPPSPRSRGGLRRPVGCVRPLSPAEGQRRSHGEWDRRARHAGDGGRRQGG